MIRLQKLQTSLKGSDEIAYTLTKKLDLPCAEIARQLGISDVAVLKMMKKENRP